MSKKKTRRKRRKGGSSPEVQRMERAEPDPEPEPEPEMYLNISVPATGDVVPVPEGDARESEHTAWRRHLSLPRRHRRREDWAQLRAEEMEERETPEQQAERELVEREVAAEREVEAAGELLRQWEASRRRDSAPFDLTVQSMIGDARVTLKDVTSEMSVAELQALVQAKMATNPTPLMQRLFIADGKQRPLEDETLPIGAYGVVDGVTLHLAPQDVNEAGLRMQLRQEARARAEARTCSALAGRCCNYAADRCCPWHCCCCSIGHRAAV